jgi:mono/diheme cytochrome c family protein
MPIRLAGLPVSAKLTLTAFLALVGAGYLVAVTKINIWHNDADGVAGMSADDLRAIYHGLDVTVTSQVREPAVSPMLREVSPGGAMHKHLVKGGEPAERTLIAWLKDGAKQATFDKPGLVQPNDPSPKQIFAERCVECHHADGGEEEDVPYAANAKAEPQYELVAKEAVSPLAAAGSKSETRRIEPISTRELLHVTHAHILSIPVFALIVSVLFLMTGVRSGIKLVLAPLPMAATCLDIACWWLARPFEPAIYGILAAGAVFGTGLALQILIILGSMWFGRRPAGEHSHGL